MMKAEQERYWSPYFAGFILGLVLLATFVLMGRGLGASGALMRGVVYAVDAVNPAHVENNPYFAKYAGGEKNPLNDWLVFEVLGVIVGGLLSGFMAKRLKLQTEHGPHISDKGRLALALLGGAIMGFGARLALGCTSGQALSGGATMMPGSWLFMFSMFGAGYGIAYFVRKQWI